MESNVSALRDRVYPEISGIVLGPSADKFSEWLRLLESLRILIQNRPYRVLLWFAQFAEESLKLCLQLKVVHFAQGCVVSFF